MSRLRLGTRRSPLALWQARHVASLLERNEPGLQVELVEIVTKGDKILDAPLAKVGGKGLFVKELEEQLLSGGVDLAVHSLKDMPGVLPQGLCLAAIPEREDPRDAFVSATSRRLDEVPRGARIGTSSLRRGCQLRAWRADLEIVPIRGNVQTRLRKIDTELAGGVLAVAGLVRLGLGERIAEALAPSRLLPAVGQGALAIEARDGDAATLERLGRLEHRETRLAVSCERAFLRRLGGGCQVPIAGAARLENGELLFEGLVGDPDGSAVVRYSGRAAAGSVAEAEALGLRGAEHVLANGARPILDRVLVPGEVPES